MQIQFLYISLGQFHDGRIFGNVNLVMTIW